MLLKGIDSYKWLFLGMRPPSIGPAITPGPPPAVPPPPVPASPAGARKLSLQTPPPPNSNNSFYGRQPEKMGENKIIKFGETSLRSPSPGPGAKQPASTFLMRNGPERKTRYLTKPNNSLFKKKEVNLMYLWFGLPGNLHYAFYFCHND